MSCHVDFSQYSQGSDFNSSFKGSQNSESIIDFESELTSSKSSTEDSVSKTSDMRRSENEYFVDAESVLEKFSKWMESVDGGEKNLIILFKMLVRSVKLFKELIQPKVRLKAYFREMMLEINGLHLSKRSIVNQ